jgi:hypothetical protein
MKFIFILKDDYCARLKKIQESLMPTDLKPNESPKKQQPEPEPESDIEIIETPKDLVQVFIFVTSFENNRQFDRWILSGSDSFASKLVGTQFNR